MNDALNTADKYRGIRHGVIGGKSTEPRNSNEKSTLYIFR
jgi:hypothetical protein